MRISIACEACGKRAKRWAIKNKKNLCMKHYNMLIINRENVISMINTYKVAQDKKRVKNNRR